LLSNCGRGRSRKGGRLRRPFADLLAASNILRNNTAVLKGIMYSSSSISKGGVAVDSVVQHSTFRRDSALAVYKVDDVNDEYLDAKPVVTYDDAVLKLEDDVDSNINVYTLKQAGSEEDDLLSEAPKQRKRTRKTKNRIVSIKSSCAAGDEKARVGCPFYKMDPRKHAQKTSCRGIGFSEMAKLK
jgi:hypothetical protein